VVKLHRMIEIVIQPRTRDLGGFTVRRSLPAAVRRAVGPFVFFDHMGPAGFAPGDGIDVRPHPHINLATVTYLFEGEILHRDSLGSEQPIRPGAVNWMTAGSGIVHSERSPAATRKSGARVHGLQLWVGLPTAHEEDAPAFHHHPAAAIPEVERPGARLRVVAGAAYGATSPVAVLSPTLYVDVHLERGAELALPDEHAERAAYVIDGAAADADDAGATHGPGAMLLFAPGPARLVAREATRVVLLGGAPLDGERHVYWNFVSSSRERIERAKDDWRARRFPLVPGDEVDFIPLPE
jgi:redox-sensitive bicupin YhaK (pirin superfamily)